MIEDDTVKIITSRIYKDPASASVHDAGIILEYSLQGATTKKDLTDWEILTIKYIRNLIKGL